MLKSKSCWLAPTGACGNVEWMELAHSGCLLLTGIISQHSTRDLRRRRGSSSSCFVPVQEAGVGLVLYLSDFSKNSCLEGHFFPLLIPNCALHWGWFSLSPVEPVHFLHTAEVPLSKTLRVQGRNTVARAPHSNISLEIGPLGINKFLMNQSPKCPFWEHIIRRAANQKIISL